MVVRAEFVVSDSAVHFMYLKVALGLPATQDQKMHGTHKLWINGIHRNNSLDIYEIFMRDKGWKDHIGGNLNIIP